MGLPNWRRSLAYAAATSRAPCAMPDGLGGDAGPGPLEGLHRDREALALGAQPVVDRDADAVEGELRRGRAADAHLVLDAGDREARPVRLHQERRQAAAGLVRVRVGDREDDDVVRDAAVADEALRAVDDVLVAVADGPGADARRVGARVRLGQPEGDQLLARGEAGQPAVLLLGRAGDLDRDGAERLDREDQARRGAGAADLLDGQAQRQQVRAETAVPLLERDREDVVGGEEPADVLGPGRRSGRSRRRAGRSARRRGRGRRRAGAAAPRSGARGCGRAAVVLTGAC